jgi:hypothetical protein
VNEPSPNSSPEALHFALTTFRQLCEDALGLLTREKQALQHPDEYHPLEFIEQRKHLLSGLESALIRLTEQRANRGPEGQTGDVKSLLQTVEGLLMSVLSLDRENHQSLLQLGLVPAAHLPPIAAQRPQIAAGFYRQHSRA